MSKSIEDVTGTVIELLTPEADPSVQKNYLQPLRCVVFDAALHVFSPNRYILDFIQTHCHERLQAIAGDLESVVDAQVCYRVGNWQDHFTFPQKLSACLCEAGVPPRYVEARLSQVYRQYPQQIHNVNFIQDYVVQFCSHTASNLIFSGGVGVGKTYLACAMMAELLTQSVSCRYIRVNSLIRTFQSTYSGLNRDNEQSLLTRFSRYDFLVIDEVGLQRQTEAAMLILSEVLYERFDRLKPTLLISNWPVQGNDQQPGFSKLLGSRLFDRLTGKHTQVLRFNWPSYRQLKTDPSKQKV